MWRHCNWAFLAALLLISSSLAQGDKKKPNPNEVEMVLVDGSKIRMSILQENVEIVTKYGKLTVPTGDLRRIEFGRHVSDELGKKIEEAIKALSDDNFEKREAASKELITLGAPAYHALAKAARTSDPEVLRLAKAALDKIREKVPEKELAIKEGDTLHTNESSIRGRITQQSIKAKALFGDTEIKIADLRGIRWINRQGEVELTIEGNKFARFNQWLDTGLEVDTDDDLEITASGKVNLNDQNNGQMQFVVGPMGSAQWGQQMPNIVPGALYGRVGDDGQFFLIGEKFTGSPRKTGKLYLNIGQGPWGQVNITGSYKVRIVGGREADTK